jgi:hypothetical protein
VFAQATALIPYRSAAVAQVLTDERHPWSVHLDGDGGNLLARVGISIGRIPIYKEVQLEIGRVGEMAGPDRMMLPVAWDAVGGPPLFPRMEGTLHLEPHGGRSTRLTLNASYDPPMGALGALIDRALMHRLAKSTMEDFVNRLARALSDELQRSGEDGPATEDA